MIRALFKYLVYRMLFRFIWRICLVAAAFGPISWTYLQGKFDQIIKPTKHQVQKTNWKAKQKAPLGDT